MPLWLGLLGIATPVPTPSVSSLVGHPIWEVVLDVLYEIGERHVGDGY